MPNKLFKTLFGKKRDDKEPPAVPEPLPEHLPTQPSTANFPTLAVQANKPPDLRLNPKAIAMQNRHEYLGPDAMTASVPVGSKVAIQDLDEKIKAYGHKAQMIMMIALEKPIDYMVLVTMYKEEFTNDELIEEATLIVKNWYKV